MIDTGRIRGVLFDYGGTIDTNGIHWSEVIWQAYQASNVPITKEMFREVYIHGERTLGKNPIIQPHHTFLDMMRIKIDIQMEWLRSNKPLAAVIVRHESTRQDCFAPRYDDTHRPSLRGGTTKQSRDMIAYCYNYARTSVEKARPVIEWMASRYPLVMVTNFYGNMRAVLSDFRIDHLFSIIIESSVVGVRKPDPQIFRLGVEALQLPANEIVVIGDSYDKDILPAKTVGCQTAWLKNTGWNEYSGNETADLIISDFAELRKWM